jgi:putative heme iron utilization protein
MEKDADKEKLFKRISELESFNDQLVSELRFLDNLLRKVGFDQGLVTLKSAAQELIQHDKKDFDDNLFE